MNDKTVKLIPYGLSNYEQLVQKNCYYVDKTMFLKTVEDAGDYLFFIRPRRFGKSLFLSVMEAYYDVYYKDRFEELFKGTWIYENPTEERGIYLVLPFNFSAVDPAEDKMETSFLNHIRWGALSFLQKYPDYLIKDREYYRKNIEESRSGSDILSAIISICKNSNQRLYVIVDEYDNFTNTILSTIGEKAYQALTHGEGFFKSFFNVLKAGTTGMGAPIRRLFLTGVSPVTLDDVTSGYNIGKNVSLEPHFNRMLGFSKEDVTEMIQYYRGNGLINHETGYLLTIMTEWYGNYCFSEDDTMKLFNSDMVLYFIDNYLAKQSIPKELIDRNVRIDYGKLKHLIIVDRDNTKTVNGNFSKLKDIVEKGETSGKLVKAFPLEELMETDNFVSLLVYFGLLTIHSVQKDKLQLKIPNETMKRLYYDYIKRAYREMHVYDLDLSRYSDLISDMAFDGKWEPFFKFITGRMRESMSLRDLITGEKSIQAFLNVYLGLSNLYIIHTEKELNKGYADIVMEPFLAGYEGITYSYALEIKYIKPKEGRKPGNTEIKRLKTDADKKLEKYSVDEKFRKTIQKTTLVKLVLIFAGHDLIEIYSPS